MPEWIKSKTNTNLWEYNEDNIYAAIIKIDNGRYGYVLDVNGVRTDVGGSWKYFWLAKYMANLSIKTDHTKWLEIQNYLNDF